MSKQPSLAESGMKKPVADAAARALPHAVILRRTIHRNPELSGEETGTAALVHARLKALGLSPRFCTSRTGVVAEVRNGTGPVMALRADMDALPVEEKTGAPFSSVKKGVMHACGHDLHTAALLGAAEALLRLKAHWRGTAVLLFQPSEEAEPSGARRMIAEGVFPADAVAVVGLHVNPEHETGVIGIKPGPDYSGITDFDVTITGKGGHSSRLDRVRDPVPCCASMILALEAMINRERPPFEPAVLAVGQVSAGTRRNVIPDQAIFCGTLRTFSTALQGRIMRRMRECCSHVARAHGCCATVSFDKSFPAGHNDRGLAARGVRALAALLGEHAVQMRNEPMMASEDFTYFQRQAPGLFAHLGVRPPRVKSMPGLHSARFLPDENALKTGIVFHVAMVLELLKK